MEVDIEEPAVRRELFREGQPFIPRGADAIRRRLPDEEGQQHFIRIGRNPIVALPYNPIVPVRRPNRRIKKTYKKTYKRKASYKRPLRKTKKMPYKKKRRATRKPAVNAGVKAITYSLNRAIRNAKKDAEINAAAALLNDPAGPIAMARANRIQRQAYMVGIGRGSYKFGKRMQRFGQGAFGSALKGNALDLIGSGVGAMTGSGMYTGRGGYTDNALIDTGLGVAEEVPSFASAGDETGSVIVCKKEYICDIYGPPANTPFVMQAFSLNPGLEQTFPWLSQIAQNYDEYRFLQLMFTFRSTTTDIGTTSSGQCGSVIMATNYNAAAGAFSDKVTMMEYDAAMSCKTTESMRHGVECDPAKLSGAEGKYVRNNPVLVAQDAKTYDHGLFQIAVANSPNTFANASLGELWGSYTCELRKPKFYASKGLGISQDLFVSGGGTETTVLPFGTQGALLTGQQNNIFAQLTLTAGQLLITFPASFAGTIELKLCMEGLTTTGVSVTDLAGTGNVASLNDMYAASSGAGDSPSSLQTNVNQVIPAGGSALYVKHLQVAVATNGINNSWTLGFANISVAPTQSWLSLTEYNAGFSYKAANIGPPGAQSVAPVLVNAQGVLITP